MDLRFARSLAVVTTLSSGDDLGVTTTAAAAAATDGDIVWDGDVPGDDLGVVDSLGDLLGHPVVVDHLLADSATVTALSAATGCGGRQRDNDEAEQESEEDFGVHFSD